MVFEKQKDTPRVVFGSVYYDKMRECSMEKLKKKFRELFNDENSLHTSLFNIITVCGMAGGIISLFVTLIIGLEGIESLIIVITEAFLFLSFYLANVKKKIDAAAAIISVTVTLFLFPWLFFAGGGVNSGMPFWFVLGIVFEFLLARGAARVFFIMIDIAVYTSCFLVDYFLPDCVTQIKTAGGVYLDKWQSMVLLALMVGLILCFQNKVYMKMHRKDIMQKQELDEARKEAEEAREAYRKLAFTDMMTDLSNRTAFERHMEKIRSGRRTVLPEEHILPTIILVADLNYLKRINDKWGHGSGDAAIREAAMLLKKEFGGNCGCYRIGGDEFCVISERMTEDEFAARFENFLRAAAEHTTKEEYMLSVAAGYAVVGNGGIDAAFRAADRNMYERKTEMKAAVD